MGWSASHLVNKQVLPEAVCPPYTKVYMNQWVVFKLLWPEYAHKCHDMYKVGALKKLSFFSGGVHFHEKMKWQNGEMKCLIWELTVIRCLKVKRVELYKHTVKGMTMDSNCILWQGNSLQCQMLASHPAVSQCCVHIQSPKILQRKWDVFFVPNRKYFPW